MPDQRMKASFIPKKEGTYQTSTKGMRRGTLNPLLTGAVGIFIITLAVWLGLYFYQISLDSQIAERQEQLQEDEKVLDSEKVEEIFEADQRFTNVKTLVNQHFKITRLFEILQAKTISEGLQFTTLSFEGVPGNSTVRVILEGKANNFSSAVTQSDIIEREVPEVIESDVVEGDQEIEKDYSKADTDNFAKAVATFSMILTIPTEELRYATFYDDVYASSTASGTTTDEQIDDEENDSEENSTSTNETSNQ